MAPGWKEIPDRIAVVSPIGMTLAEIGELFPYNRVLFDPSCDLATLAELCAGDGAGITQQLDALKVHLETDEDEIPVALSAMSFPWLVAGVAIGSFLTNRRVPDLTPAAVSYTFAEYGYPLDIVFRSARFSALPDDPAAGDSDVTVVADIAELRAVLQRQLAAHLAGVLRVMRARGAKVGRETIRRTALEACLSALCSVEAKLGRLPRLRDDVETIFRSGGLANPLFLPTLPVIREYPTGSGGRAASVALTTCCLRFRIPGQGPCPACPSQDAAERERRMAELARLYG